MNQQIQQMSQGRNSEPGSEYGQSSQGNVNVNVASFAAKYQSKRGKYPCLRIITFFDGLYKNTDLMQDILLIDTVKY